jgi:ABC-type bacteriocin/lantibiotic exporter with double-glycine peptidase domain
MLGELSALLKQPPGETNPEDLRLIGMVRRRLLIPEVVQTSMMDCGPAALKALLEGWGISISYGRLREACQTNVDGTSIDTLEEIGTQLGLTTEQIMLPVDHVLLSASHALPAIIVVRHPSGVTHFLVVWRKHGRLLQLMDPATGRRWVTRQRFLDDLYVHKLPVPANAWRQWAGSDEFLRALEERLAAINLSARARARLLKTALDDGVWHSLAALDAATRLVAAIFTSGGISDRQAPQILEAFFRNAQSGEQKSMLTIPAAYWSVTPVETDSNEEHVLLRGAVLMRVKGVRAIRAHSIGEAVEEGGAASTLSPELVAALAEKPARPLRELLRMFLTDGLLAPGTVLVALALASGGIIVEALLLRGVLDVGRELVLSGQRLGAFVALFLFLLTLFLLEIPIAAAVLNFGRRLELRLRIAFLEKLPRLSDRYFHSRLTSDMAERGQRIRRIRSLPELASHLLRAGFSVILTTAALIWLSPTSASLVVVAAFFAVIIPFIANPGLTERDLRVRTHVGALSRCYMDALQGLLTIRAHSAEHAVRLEHEGLLAEWARASKALQRSIVLFEALQLSVGFGLAALLSYTYLRGEIQAGGAVLLIYWALSLPALGQDISILSRLVPVYRNITLRLLEPMGAIEEEELVDDNGPSVLSPSNEPSAPVCGVHIALNEINVRAGGHTILEGINVIMERGSHIAIVGPSGAGKSSLVGLLLGWHKPAGGLVVVDNLALDAHRLDELRRQTAWIDPSIQLWNRSLIKNLRYGTQDDPLTSITEVIEAADLGALLERLPDGLQTTLGESGALVSGGEGQRVRLGRAMLRAGVRLVILDEPFRGLDRDRRRALLKRARRLWKGATLICITHDISDTLSFERVLVVENGHIVEDGIPFELSKQANSRYRCLLDAEEAVRRGLWSGVKWRRLRLDRGYLSEINLSGEK